MFGYKKRKDINTAQFSDQVSIFGSFMELYIINHIEFIIDNCFISYNHLVFKQTIGIPMGTNCASHLANIFLHIYETLFIHKLIEGHTFLNSELYFIIKMILLILKMPTLLMT